MPLLRQQAEFLAHNRWLSQPVPAATIGDSEGRKPPVKGQSLSSVYQGRQLGLEPSDIDYNVANYLERVDDILM